MAAMKDDLLESWKEIAKYVDRGVRTVQRWEKLEGMPVHRHTHEKRASAYAYKSEIDAWWDSRRAELEPSSPSRSTARARSKVLRKRAGWIAAGLLSAVLFTAAFLIPTAEPVIEAPRLRTPLPFTTLPGSEYFPSFSPDGNHVAFSWHPPGQAHDIYVKAIGSERPQKITDNFKDDLGPSWSPDGRWIAFLRGDRTRNPVRDVLIVPAMGGAERKLGETQPDWGPFLAWTPDAGGVIYSHCRPPEPCALKLVRLDSLEEQQLTRPPLSPGGDTAPAVSSDGRRLLFVRRSGGHTARIFLQRMNAAGSPVSEPEPITRADEFATAPAWAADGRAFFYMTGEVGVSMILWRREPSQAATPLQLATLGSTFFEPGISVHGDRLVAVERSLDSNVHKVDLKSGEVATKSLRLTSSNRMDTFPHYSPDGRKIAFDSTRYGGSDIFVMNEDGSAVFQLTSFGRERARCPSWSPDGKQIAFTAGAVKGDIHVIPSGGGTARLLVGGAADDSLPSWSPDGQSVYFTSDRSGQSEIWAISARGGEAVQLTSQGGYRPIAGADGRFVYYTKHDFGAPHGAPLWRVAVDGTSEEPVFESPVFLPENFAVSGSRIFYSTVDNERRVRSIRVFDLESGDDREVAEAGSAIQAGLSVAPDGSSVLYSHADYQGSDLVMFEGL